MAETYSQWLKDTGLDATSWSTTVLHQTWQWHQKHPHEDWDAQVNYGNNLAHPKGQDYSIGDRIQQSLSPPGHFGKGSDPTKATTNPAATAPAPATNEATSPAKADAAGVKTGNAGLDAQIAAARAGGTIPGSVTLWPSLGVDPDATVLGTEPTPGRKTSILDLPPGSTVTAPQDGHTSILDFPAGSPFINEHPGLRPVTRTADEWLKGLYKMGPQELTELQQRLWSQGWYNGTDVKDPSMIQYGRPDSATLAAYAEALGETARYNAAGKRIGINGVIDMGSPSKGQAGAGQGQPYEKTNPADLAAALRAQSQQDLGRDPTAEETRAYEQQYLAQEDSARRQLIQASIANQTVGVTGPASPSAGAEQFVDVHNLVDKTAYGAAVRQQAFFNMLKSPV